MDEALAPYVIDASEAFGILRSAATQLAGLLLVQALDRRDQDSRAASFERARLRLACAHDRLKSLRPSPQAAHHHLHLSKAADQLSEAFALAEMRLNRRSVIDWGDRCEAALNRAIAQLRAASRSLPGLEMADLDGACCACHPAPAPRR